MRYNLDGYGAPYNTSSYTALKPICAIKITARGVAAKTKIRLPLGTAKISLSAKITQKTVVLNLGAAGVNFAARLNLHTIAHITGSPATIAFYATAKARITGYLRLGNMSAGFGLTANQPAVKTKQRLRLPATSIVILAIPAKIRQKIYLTANARDILAYGAANLPVDVYEYAYLALPELVLAPGQTLVIDSDDITVTVDGANAISYWQTGSRPILLGGGANTLIYEDASAGRELACHVVWRDRWI